MSELAVPLSTILKAVEAAERVFKKYPTAARVECESRKEPWDKAMTLLIVASGLAEPEDIDAMEPLLEMLVDPNKRGIVGVDEALEKFAEELCKRV